MAEAGPEDAQAAVAAARRAFDGGEWGPWTSAERAELLDRLADKLEAEADEVARLEALDTGKRLVEAKIDMADVVSVFRHFAKIAQADAGRVVDTANPAISSRIVHEPVGVCTLITPWNFPLLQTSWKVACPPGWAT